VITVSYSWAPTDCIYVWLRCPEDPSKDRLLNTVPLSSISNENKITLKTLKVTKLPGLTKGSFFYIEIFLTKFLTNTTFFLRRKIFLNGSKIFTKKFFKLTQNFCVENFF
jgi:hypothetical protein